MKLRRAFLGFSVVTVCYVGALVWADAENHVFYGVSQIGSALAYVATISLISYSIRFARWDFMLRRAGFHTGVVKGALAYMAGFAFTATPGKLGELVRIRYLAPLGIPSGVTLSAFIFERAIDLVTVLALAALFVHQSEIFVYVAGFVGGGVALLLFFVQKAHLTKRLSSRIRLVGAKRVSKLINSLSKGLVGCRKWFTCKDVLISMLLGLLAWGGTSLSFVYLCRVLGLVHLPILDGISIYPTAMLVGAASMIPGGMGSTEGTIVAMLMSIGKNISLATAALAAIGIRISTLWLSIVCGLISIAALESRTFKNE